jgi:dihydroneopterin aldolase
VLTIELNKLRFHAYHGLYEEEKKLGGEFEVNVLVKHLPQKSVINHLEDTIDYTSVYQLIKKQMSIAEPLLETLAMNIAEDIFRKFSLAKEVNISVTKLHPPFINFEGSITVSYHCKR